MNRKALLHVTTAGLLLAMLSGIAAGQSFEPPVAPSTTATPPTAPSLEEERDCVIGPHEVVEVSSAVPGQLEAVLVERSDTVVAGQLLARLESQVEQASLELAEAWASIESEVRIEETSGALDLRRNERIARLYDSQAVALDDRDRAQTEARLAALRLRQAQEKRWIRELDARKAQAAVERRLVRSPIDGVVVERFRSAGEYVENQPVVRIARLDPLQVETILPMARFGEVEKGMVAEITTEVASVTETGEPLRATVRLVDRMGDAASGTFSVRLTLANPGNRIPAGLRCRLRFVPGAPVTLPAEPAPDGAPAPEPPASASPAPSPVDDAAPPTRRAALAPDAVTAFAVAPASPPSGRDAPLDTAKAPADAVAPAGAQCAVLGPFDAVADARALASSARARALEARVDAETVAEPAGFIVVTPAQPDLDAAHRLARRAAAAGVRDLQVMVAGVYANRVSLGVYDGASMAEHRRDRVSSLGVDAQVLERTRSRERWWLRLAGVDRVGALPASLRAGAVEAPCAGGDAAVQDLIAGVSAPR